MSAFLFQVPRLAARLTPFTVRPQCVGLFLLCALLLGTHAAAAAEATKPPPKPPTAAAIAARKADAAHYAACMAKIDTNAKDAFDDADSWVALSGSEAAKHCAAAALLKLGFPDEAAQRLQTLARTSNQDNVTRAHMLAQAGEAWTEAKNWEQANAAQSAALGLAPKDIDLWIGRARTRALAQNYGLAVDDLNAALKLAPANPDVLVLRASAYRYMDALDLALEDLNTVLKDSPDNPAAHLERGIVYRLKNQPNAARADWAAALRVLPEDAPMIEDIRRNIELLEFPEPTAPPAPASATKP
ncbi:MAG: hypothetical protein JXQ84_07125 [Rhodospirillaceae bacterium]|nr:hypothetical protein [Rhodospirillaceae bacterium]